MYEFIHHAHGRLAYLSRFSNALASRPQEVQGEPSSVSAELAGRAAELIQSPDTEYSLRRRTFFHGL